MSQGKGKGENHTTGSDSRPSESSSPYSHGQVEPQRFLAAVLKSGLLKREDLKRFLEDMPKSRLVSTETLADGLVEAGALKCTFPRGQRWHGNCLFGPRHPRQSDRGT